VQPRDPLQSPDTQSPSGESASTSAAADADTNLQVPRDVIWEMKDKVMGFDFFVTGTENYEADGVLFRGNLRGDAPVAFKKIEARMRVRPLKSVHKLHRALPRVSLIACC
jgi:hypothetical protein